VQITHPTVLTSPSVMTQIVSLTVMTTAVPTVMTTISGITRGLSQGRGTNLAKGAQPSLKYEIIGRNFNVVEKSELCSKVIYKLSESNNLGVWGQSPQPPDVSRGLGREPPMLRQFFQFFFSKIKHF